MTQPGSAFRRMLLDLPQSTADAALAAAVEFAERLEVELLGTFITDATLLDLAGMPHGRELRTFATGWQPIERVQISQELAHAAAHAQRRFSASVAGRAMQAHFDVVTGTEAIAARIRADDIVAIIEPAHPGERISQQFTTLLDAALQLAAAVLVVPSRIARTTGPIVAVARGPDDPNIRLAAQIAAALRESLVVLDPSGIPLPLKSFDRPSPNHAAQAKQAVRMMRERLRIISLNHLTTTEVRQLLSSLHGTPVLIIGSERGPDVPPTPPKRSSADPARPAARASKPTRGKPSSA